MANCIIGPRSRGQGFLPSTPTIRVHILPTSSVFALMYFLKEQKLSKEQVPFYTRVKVVAQLVERSLPTPDIRGSNPFIDK